MQKNLVETLFAVFFAVFDSIHTGKKKLFLLANFDIVAEVLHEDKSRLTKFIICLDCILWMLIELIKKINSR